jgi:ABC-type Na+ transport system ATPase subunit NatA
MGTQKIGCEIKQKLGSEKNLKYFRTLFALRRNQKKWKCKKGLNVLAE